MLASKMIAQLKALIDEHGDKEVYYYDVDYGYNEVEDMKLVRFRHTAGGKIYEGYSDCEYKGDLHG